MITLFKAGRAQVIKAGKVRGVRPLGPYVEGLWPPELVLRRQPAGLEASWSIKVSTKFWELEKDDPDLEARAVPEVLDAVTGEPR